MSLPLLSRPTLNDLGTVIGSDKLQRLLDRFTASLRIAFTEVSPEPSTVAQEAHTLISMSGMLGCERLSAACRTLEIHAKDGADLAQSLAEMRALRDETVRALEDLSPAS